MPLNGEINGYMAILKPKAQIGSNWINKDVKNS